jgi:uncharacterized protein (DUF433 family)
LRIVFDELETGETVDDFLAGYPSVSQEAVIAFLEFVSVPVSRFAD